MECGDSSPLWISNRAFTGVAVHNCAVSVLQLNELLRPRFLTQTADSMERRKGLTAVRKFPLARKIAVTRTFDEEFVRSQRSLGPKNRADCVPGGNKRGKIDARFAQIGADLGRFNDQNTR